MTVDRARGALLAGYLVALVALVALPALDRPSQHAAGSTIQLLEARRSGRAPDVVFEDDRDGTGRLIWQQDGRTWEILTSTVAFADLRPQLEASGGPVRSVDPPLNPLHRLAIGGGVVLFAVVFLIAPLAVIAEVIADADGDSYGVRFVWIAIILLFPVLGVVARVLTWPSSRPGPWFWRVAVFMSAAAFLSGATVAVLAPHATLVFEAGTTPR